MRVKISSSKSALLFGAPHLFIGERSSLGLAAALLKYADCFVASNQPSAVTLGGGPHSFERLKYKIICAKTKYES
jgi:hypothetical protein